MPHHEWREDGFRHWSFYNATDGKIVGEVSHYLNQQYIAKVNGFLKGTYISEEYAKKAVEDHIKPLSVDSSKEFVYN